MYEHNFLYESYNISPWIGAWIYAFIAYFGGFIFARIFHLFWDPIDPKRRKKKRLKEAEAAAKLKQ